MFENLCTLPLSSNLFAQAIHPTEAVLAVGLAGGHVESFRLSTVAGSHASEDDEDEMDMSMSVASTGTSTIETEWRTRRHRGSCRTLAYSVDGEALYSSGTDRLVKAASSQTGRVFAKIAIPPTPNGQDDAPSLLHALSPQTLLLATDSAALHVYDLRQPNTITSKPAQTHRPHDDYLTSLTPLPPSALSTSGYSKQWVSTGGSTLAVTDLRKGTISRSEDQEDELLSSLFVGGLPAKPGKSKGEKLILGDSSGVLTLWERGFWDDQQERIRVATQNKNCSAIESLALVPDSIGDGRKSIVVGNEDGHISIINLGQNKIISNLQHDELEGVVELGFDVHDRLISGGGLNIKVWQEKLSSDTSDNEEEDESSDSSDDEDEEDDTEDEDRDLSETQKKQSKSCTVSIGGSLNAHGIMKFQDMD